MSERQEVTFSSGAGFQLGDVVTFAGFDPVPSRLVRLWRWFRFWCGFPYIAPEPMQYRVVAVSSNVLTIDSALELAEWCEPDALWYEGWNGALS